MKLFDDTPIPVEQWEERWKRPQTISDAVSDLGHTFRANAIIAWAKKVQREQPELAKSTRMAKEWSDDFIDYINSI